MRHETFLKTFLTTYPSASSTQLNSCGICHVNPAGGGSRNSYGADFANTALGDRTFNATLAASHPDGDGYTNLVEINAATFPGNSASYPAAAGDTTLPTVTSLQHTCNILISDSLDNFIFSQ